jgi:hypothetical protein
MGTYAFGNVGVGGIDKISSKNIPKYCMKKKQLGGKLPKC